MNRISAWLLFLVLCFGPAGIYAQKAKSDTVSDSLTARLRVFTASWMFPMKGTARNLTQAYDVRFSKDTLYGRLPYVGESSQVDYGTADVGVNLSTGDFTVTEKPGKKGARVLVFQLKHARDARTLNLTIYPDSTADLQLLFLQRQPISYRGKISSDTKSAP